MVNLYNEQPHSCLLYIGSVIVDEYGDNKAVEKPLIQMFKVKNKFWLYLCCSYARKKMKMINCI